MTNILGPPVGYIDLLDEATTKHLEKEAAGPSKYTPIRPSSSGKCTRELFYELMEYKGYAKYPKELRDPESHRLLNLGHSVEYHVIKQLELLKDQFDIRYKQQVLSFAYLKSDKDPSLNQWLEGSLDLVFWSDKYKCVADVKSKKDRFSQSYASAWDQMSARLREMSTVVPISENAFWVDDLPKFLDELNDAFFEANFLQLNLYACSSFLRERGVDHGAVLQYGKNDSRLREVRFRPSMELYEKTIRKFQTVVDAVAARDENLAPRDYVLGSMKCAFCPFAQECWEGADSRKAWYKTMPAKSWPKDTSHLGRTGDELESLFMAYKALEALEADKSKAEEAIVKRMTDAEVGKIRLADGRVYELKHLKSPRPRIELRRSKA